MAALILLFIIVSALNVAENGLVKMTDLTPIVDALKSIQHSLQCLIMIGVVFLTAFCLTDFKGHK
jgi:hypothetical protein